MEIIRIRVALDGEKPALTALKKIDAEIDKINKKKVSVNVNTNDAAKAKKSVDELGTAAGNTAKQGKILGDTLSMIKFTAISAAIGGVTTALHSALNEMKAVDTQLTNIRKVSGQTTAELQALGDKAYSTASKYGVAADEYLSAVYTFQKAGLGDAADQLGELATKTMLVGDTTADIASKFLISVNAAWDLQGSMSALSTVVDEADYINNNYATSLDKLAAAMPIVASTSANLGMSIEETMAVIGTITAKTQETGTKAATAWRALAMNITGELGTIYDETGEAIEVTENSVASIADALRIYGSESVKAAQASGKIINPMEAVVSLAEAYKDGLLTDIELQNIMMDVGGKLRTNQLTSLVKDLASETSTYYDIMSKLPNAAGTADAEIGIMLDSWESKAKILSNTWTEFVQKSLSTDSIKGLLDGATRLLEVMDNLGNAVATVGPLMVAAFGKNIASGISGIVTALNNATTSAFSLGSAISLVGIAMAGVNVALTLQHQNTEKQIENAQQAVSEANKEVDALQTQADTLDSLKKKYSDLYNSGTGSRKEFKAIQEAIVDLVGEQAQNIDLANGKYEEQLALLGQIAEANAEAVEQAKVAQTASYIDLIKAATRYQGLDDANMLVLAGLNAADNGYINDVKAVTQGLNSINYGWNRGQHGFYVDYGATVEDAVAAYDDLLELRNRMLDWAGTDANKLSGNVLWKSLNNEIDALKDFVEEYKRLTDKGSLTDNYGKDNYFDNIKKSAQDAASGVEDSTRRITRAKADLEAASSAGDRSTDFDSYSSAYKTFLDEVEAGRINSNAFWASAEFLTSPDVLAQLGYNAKDVIEYIENSAIPETFGNAEIGVGGFVDALNKAADAAGEIADGAAKITGEEGNYQIVINDVEALAEAFRLNEDQIYACIEALGDYGEYDLSDSALTEYLEWLGVTFDELGQTDFTSVVQTLSQMGYPVNDIKTIVDQLQEMNAIDMGDFSGSISDINTVLGRTAGASAAAKSNIEALDGAKTNNVTTQLGNTESAARNAAKQTDNLKTSLRNLNGTSATTTITTRNITEYVTVSSNYASNTTSGLKLWAEGQALLNPTGGSSLPSLMATHASGTKNAQAGLALVGDERSTDGSPRPELINDNGRMYLAGQYGPEIVRLGSGAQVFSYNETRQIAAGAIPAYANGVQSTSRAASNSLFSSVANAISNLKNTANTSGSTTKTSTTTSDKITITYKANGGSGGPSTSTATKGKASYLSNLRPTRSGYTFLGWGRSSSATKATWQPGGTITAYANQTLYAVWEKNSTSQTTSGLKDLYDKTKANMATALETALSADYSGTYSGPTSYTTTTYSGGGGGGYTSSYGGGGGGGSSSGSSSASDPLVELRRKIDEDLQDREFAIWHGLTAGTMTLPEAIAAYEDAMKAVQDYEDKFRELGEQENSDYIQDLIKQWYAYADEIKDIQRDLMDELTVAIEEELDAAEKAKDARIAALNDEADKQEYSNKLLEKSIALSNAKRALENAQGERTVRIYNPATGQWEWVANAADVKKAQENVAKAQEDLDTLKSDHRRDLQIARIEREYEALETAWGDIRKGMDEPGRSLADITADIAKIGTDAQKKAGTDATELSAKIAAGILSINRVGAATVGGQTVMYGASPTTSGGAVVANGSQNAVGYGNNYYINGVEISGDRADSMTVAELARSLSTLAIYNNS